MIVLLMTLLIHITARNFVFTRTEYTIEGRNKQNRTSFVECHETAAIYWQTIKQKRTFCCEDLCYTKAKRAGLSVDVFEMSL